MTEPEFVITDWRPVHKGESLRGFLALQLPPGLILHGFTLHECLNGARWIGLPARQYRNGDGETKWSRIVDFASKQAQQKFQRAAMAAIDRFFGHGKAEDDARDRVLAGNRASTGR